MVAAQDPLSARGTVRIACVRPCLRQLGLMRASLRLLLFFFVASRVIIGRRWTSHGAPGHRRRLSRRLPRPSPAGRRAVEPLAADHGNEMRLLRPPCGAPMAAGDLGRARSLGARLNLVPWLAGVVPVGRAGRRCRWRSSFAAPVLRPVACGSTGDGRAPDPLGGRPAQVLPSASPRLSAGSIWPRMLDASAAVGV